jgi:hypothetical protein
LQHRTVENPQIEENAAAATRKELPWDTCYAASVAQPQTPCHHRPSINAAYTYLTGTRLAPSGANKS